MLKILKNGFPSVLDDNTIVYLDYLFKTISLIDDESQVKIDKKNEFYNISVLVSNLSNREELIKRIEIAHEIIGLEIEFSKSLKISSYISWIVK